MMMGSISQVDRSNAVGHNPSYLPEVNPGMQGGGTYTGSSSDPTIQDYENIFGPSARDIKTDLQRFKRHGRWHLPDVLKGPNPWLTDRIDGLITDATNSPFTTKILPYMYKEDVDGKMKWNVWSFDEGMASRVPYESAARTLQQSKRSFSAYMVRHGMAIVLEHNFMMSPKGRENFKNQLNQLVGSIQYSNDFDVHMALVLAPSYQKTMREQYYTIDKTPSQICRDFCDLFGMMQKNVNALDILIEEAKAILKTWGGPMPDFLLCNSKLTFQLTMTPEKTNYITQGTDGQKRLKQGPDLASYRGLSVIHSRAFSLEKGQHPRDILRRRVRTAEYYRILPNRDNDKREFELYNEGRDTWFSMTFEDLLAFSRLTEDASNESLSSGLGHQARTACPWGKPSLGYLGTPSGSHASSILTVDYGDVFVSALRALEALWEVDSSSVSWAPLPCSFNLSVKFSTSYPTDELAQCNNDFVSNARSYDGSKGWKFSGEVSHYLRPLPGFVPSLVEDFLGKAERTSQGLRNPFTSDVFHRTRDTTEWYNALCFYLDVYRRCGVSLCLFEFPQFLTPEDIVKSETEPKGDATGEAACFMYRSAFYKDPPVSLAQCGRADFFLSPYGLKGSVNHVMNTGRILNVTANHFWNFCGGRVGGFYGRSVLITSEFLKILMSKPKSGNSGKRLYGEMKTLGRTMFNQAQKAKFLDILETSKTFLGQSCVNISQSTHADIVALLTDVFGLKYDIESRFNVRDCLLHGITTMPMNVSSRGHIMHPHNPCYADEAMFSEVQAKLKGSTHNYGQLPFSVVSYLASQSFTDVFGGYVDFSRSPVGSFVLKDFANEWDVFCTAIMSRFDDDPLPNVTTLKYSQVVSGVSMNEGGLAWCCMSGLAYEMDSFQNKPIAADAMESCIWDNDALLANFTLDLSRFSSEALVPPVFSASSSSSVDDKDDSDDAPGTGSQRLSSRAARTEFVIIRPNIEHNMLGVIMGLGGSELGHTLWGQTELSCYDDSMHGIWGMSYKYHERAIVFNEKNLVRLWDIAYDGYNGGKDDTYVDWTQAEGRNGYAAFARDTMNVGQSYRGASMMVMAFEHPSVSPERGFQRNWPSPIVFHDPGAADGSGAGEYDMGTVDDGGVKTLPLDSENLQVMDVSDFRVFDKQCYADKYGQYRAKMPHFHELHKMRKTAGQASAEAETQSDSLAFQGSMRVKQGGRIIQEIQGSGHHGPDYVGVASVRAGKGIKYTGQAPVLSHAV